MVLTYAYIKFGRVRSIKGFQRAHKHLVSMFLVIWNINRMVLLLEKFEYFYYIFTFYRRLLKLKLNQKMANC